MTAATQSVDMCWMVMFSTFEIIKRQSRHKQVREMASCAPSEDGKTGDAF